jgi:ferric-dicitrate binding protein FerR (iron transport regulator)
MNNTDHDIQENSDELFESLFRNAASRPRPPAGDEARARAALHEQWRGMTSRWRRYRLTTGLAAAASVMLAVLVYMGIFKNSPAPDASYMVASAVRQSGRVLAGPVGSNDPRPQVHGEETLMSGSVIPTAYDARLAMRWLEGESVRLDENTRVVLISDTEIELISGRIYVDSHTDEKAPDQQSELCIITPFGRVQHLGTQYMTSLADGKVTVSVRQGRVAVTGSDEESIANGGQQLSVSRLGEVTLSPITVYGGDWRWIEEISPGFVLDGRSLADFLLWVSHESGHSLEYGSASAESLARETVMRGTIDLQPMHALDLMLQTSDLVADVQTGVILINAE